MATDDEERPEGMTLFRDFLRHYPRARVEDYYKDGQWLMEHLEVDLALVVQHRRDAGAPDPEPIESIPEPELPRRATPWSTPSGGVATGGSSPLGSRQNGRRLPAAGVRVPQQPPGPPSAAAVAAQRGAGALGVGNDEQPIRDFIAKWRLEPARAKLLLSRLLPARRREIIDSFKYVQKDLTPTSALERYIVQRYPPASGGASSTGTGVKRVLSSSAMSREPPLKRLREDGVAGSAPSPSGVLPRGSASAGSSRGAPPPWRSEAAAGPSLRFSSSRAPLSRPVLSSKDSGDSRPPLVRSSAPAARPRSAATTGSALDDKPGDLIKNLLG